MKSTHIITYNEKYSYEKYTSYTIKCSIQYNTNCIICYVIYTIIMWLTKHLLCHLLYNSILYYYKIFILSCDNQYLIIIK